MLGNVLKLIRFANEMSTKDAAQNSNVSSTYISEVENGNKNPSISVLKKIAETYNIPLSQIFLFEELQIQDNLSNRQLLIMILEYYINKTNKENSQEINKKKIK